MTTTKKLLVLGALVGGGLLLYFKPWRQKSGDYLNLEPHELREIDYLMHGGLNYTYNEALEKVLSKRIEYKGSSGWS